MVFFSLNSISLGLLLEQFDLSKVAAGAHRKITFEPVDLDTRDTMFVAKLVTSNPLFGLFVQFEVNKRSKVMFNVMKTLPTLGSKVRFAIILN